MWSLMKLCSLSTLTPHLQQPNPPSPSTYLPHYNSFLLHVSLFHQHVTHHLSLQNHLAPYLLTTHKLMLPNPSVRYSLPMCLLHHHLMCPLLPHAHISLQLQLCPLMLLMPQLDVLHIQLIPCRHDPRAMFTSLVHLKMGLFPILHRRPFLP